MSSISVRFTHFLLFIRFSMNTNPYPRIRWSVWMDSNHRPRAYQARALTTWATDRFFSVFRFVPFPRYLGSTFVEWWRWWGSNPWPPACRAGALPAELHPHFDLGVICFFKDLFWSLKIEQQKFHTSVCANSLVISTHMTDPWKSVPVSIERRWSSRTFRYGYLVTT